MSFVVLSEKPYILPGQPVPYTITALIESDKSFVQYVAFRADGSEVGRSALKDDAVRAIRIDALSSKKWHDLTIEEFSEISIVARVVEGKGKNGNAKTGKARYLLHDDYFWTDCDEFETLRSIRIEGGRLYQRNGYSNDPQALPREKWVEAFVSSVLSFHRSADIRVVGAENKSRPIILVNTKGMGARLSRKAIIMLAYKSETEPDVPESEPVTKIRSCA